ncbi:MAG: TonB-dependent receptor, partial [Acidobacteriia bacterium]|nr:TonB-dependent receptor [Terriglobia bacterium]
VGGVSNQDPLTGLSMSLVNPDSIEEIEIITAGAGVEFGRAQGGFANIIQKQGSNDFEGTFNFLFKSSLLDGGASAYPGAPVPKYQHLEPAIQLSGPVVKDKIWYRISHEYIQEEDPVAAAGGTAVVTTKRQINSDAVTWQVSPRNKLQFTYSADPLTITNFGVGRLLPVASSERRELGGPVYRLSWTAPFSAKILVDSLVSYQDSHTNILPSTRGVPNNCVQSAPSGVLGSLPFVSQALCTNLESGQTSGSSYLTWRDKRQRLTFKSTANIFGGHFLGMDHQFKVGFSVENERYFRYEDREPDVSFYIYRPQNSNQNQSGDINPVAVVQGRFAVPTISNTRATDTASAVFFEDQIKPRQNLSITLGLRIDRESLNSDGFQPFDPAAEEEKFNVLREARAKSYAEDQVRLNPALDYATELAKDYASQDLFTEQMYQSFTGYEDIRGFTRQLGAIVGPDVDAVVGPAITASKNFYQKRRADSIDITNTNFGPHIAVSWDPWSNGKTKLAFSGRRLYGATPLNVPLSEIEPAIATLRFQAKRTATGVWQASLANGLNPAATVQVVDRNLRTPYNDELTFSLEREIFAETSAKLTYIYRRFVDQFQDQDLNHYPADYGRCLVQVDPKARASWISVVYDQNGRPIPDGKLDDCDGQLTVPFNAAGSGGGDTGGGSNSKLNLRELLHGPDGYLDTYTHNLGWGSIYMTGNFNFATYKGLQLEVIRRQYRNWQMNASYTWSRALGNGESWNSFLGDDRTTRDAEFGYLSYDVRHSVKVNATTITPWGFRAGTAVTWQSGLPYSILEQKPTADSAPPSLYGLGDPEPRNRLRYPTGRRNDQRNRPYWNVDVKLDKEMNLGKGMNLQVAADIFNLLDDRTYQIWNPFAELGDQLNGYNDGFTRIGRNYQLSMKLSF